LATPKEELKRKLPGVVDIAYEQYKRDLPRYQLSKELMSKDVVTITPEALPCKRLLIFPEGIEVNIAGVTVETEPVKSLILWTVYPLVSFLSVRLVSAV